MGYQPYLFALVTFLISLPVLFMGDARYVWYIFCIPGFILECIGLIDIAFFTYKSVDDKGILTKTFSVTNFIEWDEVYGVYFDGNNKFYKFVVVIQGKDKKTTVISWFKDYKELIKIVVDECKKRNIKVELMVEKIIED
jgi:hypothetical protein